MPETITIQEIKEKVRLKIVPVVMLTAGLALLGLAAIAVVNSVQLPTPPKLEEGKYVPAQVIFKVKPGKNPQAILAKALEDKQEVFRDTKTGKIISKFSAEVEKNPKQFQKVSLQLNQKELRQIFPKVKISDQVREKILRRNGAKDPETVYSNLGLDRWYVAEVNEPRADVAQLVQGFMADRGNVEIAEANGIAKSATGEVTPDDPQFNGHQVFGPADRDQYYLDRIHAPLAWAGTVGQPDTIVAIIDTGVNFYNPELKDNIWLNNGEDINHNGCADYWSNSDVSSHTDCHGQAIISVGDLDGLDNDGNGYYDDLNGMDFHNDSTETHNGQYGPTDIDGHGTGVAGVAGAVTNNTSIIAGTCWPCRILPVRISDYNFNSDTVAQAFIYAANQGARVINFSWAQVTDSAILHDAVRYVTSSALQGVVVASSGNNALEQGYQAGWPYYPAAWPEVIGVGALNYNNTRAGFSNYGSWLKVVAPGDRVVTISRINGWETMNGTSFSAPQVVGVVGLMLSVNPNLSTDDVWDILQTTTTDVGSAGFDDQTGYGLVNADLAVQEAQRRIPDIAVESNTNQAIVGPGNHLLVRLEISNQTWYHAYHVRYRLRDAATNTILLEESIDDLFPNGVSWISRDIPLNPNLPPTWVILNVDPQNDILETNEQNNQVLIKVVPYGTPTFQTTGSFDAHPGEQTQFTVNAVDPENQALTFQAQRLPTGSTFASRQFSWVPNSNQLGRYRKIFTATDTASLSDTLPVTTTVLERNDPYRVMLNPVGDQEIRSGKTLTFSTGAISANLTPGYKANLGVTGLPAGASFNVNTGVFTWTPTTNQQGTYTLTFSAFNNVRTFVEPIQITVLPNRPPVWLSTVGDKTVSEGNQLTFVLNGYDPDSDPLTYSYVVVNKPVGTTFDATINSSTGAFTWNPPYTAAGTYDIRLSVSDGTSAVTQDMRITVVDITTPKYTTLMSNRALLDSIFFRVNEGFYASDTNPVFPGACVDTENRCKNDWSPLNFTSANIQKSDIQFVRIKMNTFDGWNASLQNTCLDSPGLPACSAVGTSSGGIYIFDLYNNANVYFLEQDPFGTNFGAPGYIGGIVTDWNSWMAECAKNYSSRWGGVAINTTPFPGDFGTTTFNRMELCLVDHNNDTSLRSAWSVEVHRKSMNIAPVLSPLSSTYAVTELSPLSILPFATDYNEDRLWYSASPLPTGASINQFTGAFTWTPNLTQTGVYPIVFTVSDKHLSTSWATAITVNRINTAPVFYQPTNQKAVRGDDFFYSFHATDVQNDPLTYSIVSAPAGSTINGSTGDFRWHVPNDYPLGLGYIIIRANDGFGGVAMVTVTINVVIPRSGGGGGGNLCNEDGLGGKYCLNPFVIE